jgi:hypothetical protein
MVGGGSQGAPPKAATKGAKRSAKGSKKGQKQHRQRVTVTISYDDDDNKKADSFDKEQVVAAKHDLKHQTQQLSDPFKKPLEATCPNHAYPVKHKLKECTMIKKTT